jgi:CRISPR type II-A-associated protein Csn2
MKIVFPEISHMFEVKNDYVNELIVENQKFMTHILEDLNNQMEGNEGLVVLSKNDKIIQISKHCEIINVFVPFEINQKQLVNKLTYAFEKQAVIEDNYEKTMEALSNLEVFLNDIAFEMPGDILFNKLTISSLAKAVGLGFKEEYENLGEKLLDYIELVNEYDGDKLFITVNLRSYLNNPDMQKLIDMVKNRNYYLFMIESLEREMLDNTKRYLIDSDMCEIC